MKTNIFMTAVAIIFFAVTAHAIKFGYVSEYIDPMYQYEYIQKTDAAPTYSNGKRIYEGSTVCWNSDVMTDSVYVEPEAYDSGLPLKSNIRATNICRKAELIKYYSDVNIWLTHYGLVTDATISYTSTNTRINTNDYLVLYNSNTNEIILRRWDDSIRYKGTVYTNNGSRPKTMGYCYTKKGTKLSKIVTNASQCKY